MRSLTEVDMYDLHYQVPTYLAGADASDWWVDESDTAIWSGDGDRPVLIASRETLTPDVWDRLTSG